MKTTIILAPTLELATQVQPHISVEAEYGDNVITGSRYTAAHHGSRASNPCPCVDGGIPLAEEGDVILVSHLDLDTIGGVGRALGHPVMSGRHGMFWRLAAFVDTAGPHRLQEARKWDVAPSFRIERELHAYWAWGQENRGPRRDPSVIHDVTEEIERHLNVLLDIFGDAEDGELLRQGDAFRTAGETLNAESYRDYDPVTGVVTRVSPAFTNHLYTTPEGEVGEAVVAFNSKTKSVTLSFASPDDPRHAAEIMRRVFGPDAGGHKGIAGSPRGVELDEETAINAVRGQLFVEQVVTV